MVAKKKSDIPTGSSHGKIVSLNPELQEAAEAVTVHHHNSLLLLPRDHYDDSVVIMFKNEAQSARGQRILSEIIACLKPELVAEAIKDFLSCYEIALVAIRRIGVPQLYDQDGEPLYQAANNDLQSCKQLLNDLESGYEKLVVEIDEKKKLGSLGKVAAAGVNLHAVFSRIIFYLVRFDNSRVFRFSSQITSDCRLPAFLHPKFWDQPAVNVDSFNVQVQPQLLVDNKLLAFCYEITSLKQPALQWNISNADFELAVLYDKLFNHCDILSYQMVRKFWFWGDQYEDPNSALSCQHRTELEEAQQALEEYLEAQGQFVKLLLRSKNKPALMDKSQTEVAQSGQKPRPITNFYPREQHGHYSGYKVLIESVTSIRVRNNADSVWTGIVKKEPIDGLLALSLLPRKGDSITFKHKALIDLIDPKVDVPKAWNKYKTAFKSVMPGLQIESVRGTSTIKGIQFDKRLDDAEIKSHLSK